MKNFSELYNSFCSIDIGLYLPMANAFCSHIEFLIGSLHSDVGLHCFFKKKEMGKVERRPKGHFRAHFVVNIALFDQLLEVFKYLGRYVGVHCKTFIKLCQLFA